MKTVDIYVAGAKSVARNLAAQHFRAHGFDVTWPTPWHGVARRGVWDPVGELFINPADPRQAQVQFDFRVMDAPWDDEVNVLRVERRLLPRSNARIAVMAADDFELISDEIVADLTAHELVRDVLTYGVGQMIPPLTLPLPDPPAPVRRDLSPPPHAG